MRTQVGIVGAGPAGLLLSHLLHLQGIESVVLEIRDREYCERRIRAGVLEQGTVDILNESGVGARMRREGLPHYGIELRFGGARHRIAFEKLVPGRAITVYGQQEVVKDLIKARLDAGGEILFDVPDVELHGIDTAKPSITFGGGQTLECDFIAGCDGSHGVSRPSIPANALTVYDREYPFGWLGIMAKVRPSSEELIYSRNDRGFALHSMRTPELSRFYIQVPPTTSMDDWPDERIWAELKARLETVPDFELTTGPIIEKGVTPMRSFVVEPMRYGNLFLAGDAAHIVPPTGAKGLNLAVADVRVLAEAFRHWYASGSTDLLDDYTRACAKRVWRAQHFSWWMTTLLHTFDSDDAYGRKLQLSYLDYVTTSEAAATTLAENYVGVPFEPFGDLHA
ncbi:MAG TPA: 4-hydroxybenzoate 3-monooxygenase [Thermopolyspora sp.]|jgi:4-hydroxybenzoate 3-monooxygenase